MRSHFCLIICTILINSANIFLKSTSFVTFNTCLDYLPADSRKGKNTNQVWDFLLYCFFSILYSYFVELSLIPCLSEVLHSFITHFAVNLITFFLKLYVQSFFNLIYICMLLFPYRSPYIKIVSLWFLELVILLSSDIETQPGPRSSGIGEPNGDFRNGFFSFCNWNLNTLSKNDFHRVCLLEAHNS